MAVAGHGGAGQSGGAPSGAGRVRPEACLDQAFRPSQPNALLSLPTLLPACRYGMRMGFDMRQQAVAAVQAKVLRLNSVAVADQTAGKVRRV